MKKDPGIIQKNPQWSVLHLFIPFRMNFQILISENKSLLRMENANNNTIWTIGHSTRSIEEFIEMLQAFKIEVLVDVRSFPGSKRFPQFNKENLADSLLTNKIEYVHILRLGGRRTPKKDSKNTGWKHESFRGYADYMETDYFKKGIEELIEIAEKRKTAIMCSEAVWWKCHRSMISDYLKLNGWIVLHIMDKLKADEHPFTQPARIVDGKLCYTGDELFGN